MGMSIVTNAGRHGFECHETHYPPICGGDIINIILKIKIPIKMLNF